MPTHNPNSKSVYVTLGASNHTDKVRQNEDYYATDPIAAEWLLRIEDVPKDRPVWECAAGENHLADVFKEHGSPELLARHDTPISGDARGLPQGHLHLRQAGHRTHLRGEKGTYGFHPVGYEDFYQFLAC